MTAAARAIPAGLPAESERPALLRALIRVASALVSIPMLCGYVYLGLGLHLTLGLGIYEGDALSRTANAMYVLLSRDPHVAAIGFVWNPLPSIVQLPLVLALDPFELVFLAGPLQSAMFGVAGIVALDRILRVAGAGPWPRRVAAVAYGLNPMVAFYAANGMSEAALLFFMLAATEQFLRWARGGKRDALILFAILSAGTFLVRYEGVAFAAAGVFALTVAFLVGKDLEPDRLEAILLTYLVPIMYVIALWLFFNWILVGDPLYFYRSSYGNLAQTEGFRRGETYLSFAIGSLPGSITYALTRWAYVFPAVVPAVVLALGRALIRRDHVLLGTLALAASLPAFHAYLIFGGTSFGWLRFFMYGIPFAIVLMALVLEPIRRHRRATIIAWTVATVLLIASTPASYLAMRDPNYGREEWSIIGHLVEAERYPVPASFIFEKEKEIAAYVDAMPPGSVVLMDSAFAFSVNVFARDHLRYAITSDRDFKEILAKPDRGKITHILVPDPRSAEAVGAAIPGIWLAGAPYATLEKDFGGLQRWRLYRVTAAEDVR